MVIGESTRHSNRSPNNDHLGEMSSSRYPSSFQDEHGDRSLLLSNEAGNKHGISLPITSLFVISTLAGTGVLALPRAVEDTGWIGIIILNVMCCLAAYTGVLLGRCWDLVEERFPDLRHHCQNPYATIGKKACGKIGKYTVRFFNNLTVFGTCVVFVLLAGEIVMQMVASLSNTHFSMCYVVLIVSTILTPMIWFGTPVDFWPMAILGAVSTILACVLAIASCIQIDLDPLRMPVRHNGIKAELFLMSFGTISYTNSGHISFPTIQNDMKKRKDFGKSVTSAFLCIAILYTCVTIASYLTLGNKVQDNILSTLAQLNPSWMVYAAQIFILLHIISAFLITMNPLNQECEKMAGVPNKFCWQRLVVRTGLMILVVFTAETVPRFGPVLALVGGSSTTLAVYIFPVLFYEILCSRSADGNWTISSIPRHIRFINLMIITIGVVGGIASTYAALQEILGFDTFIAPCYINITAVTGN